MNTSNTRPETLKENENSIEHVVCAVHEASHRIVLSTHRIVLSTKAILCLLITKIESFQFSFSPANFIRGYRTDELLLKINHALKGECSFTPTSSLQMWRFRQCTCFCTFWRMSLGLVVKSCQSPSAHVSSLQCSFLLFPEHQFATKCHCRHHLCLALLAASSPN